MQKLPSKYEVLLLLVLAFGVRWYGIGDVTTHVADEDTHVPAASNYYHRGHWNPAIWNHPPLKHLLLYGSIRLFGDNPYGWRARNIVFGTLTVLVLFLLARELFDDRRIAFLSALLLCLDPLHIDCSRATYDEILSVFFFLLGCCFVARYLKGRTPSLVLAGIFLGFAQSVKWYFLASLPALFLFTAWQKTKDREWSGATAAHIVLAFVFLPLGIYLLTFYAWFGRGYDLLEFIRFQWDSYTELQTLTRASFLWRGVIENVSPHEWLIKPVIVVLARSAAAPGWDRYAVLLNNFPVLLFSFPAFVYASFKVWQTGDRRLAFVLVTFLSVYLPFLATDRPFFLYSLAPLLPFAYLFTVFFIISLANRSVHRDRIYRMVLAGIVVWTIYLYPLVLGRPVPAALYAPLLHFGNLFVHNRFL